MTSMLPSHDGLLPKWLLLVAITSMGNSIQAYCTLSYTQRLYSGTNTSRGPPDSDSEPAAAKSPVNPLSARTFGTWTFIVSIVRLFAAYHINEPAWYQVAFWTYVVAFAHFMSEMALYKTARWRGPWLAPACVSTSSLIWMVMQWNYYLE